MFENKSLPDIFQAMTACSFTVYNIIIVPILVLYRWFAYNSTNSLGIFLSIIVAMHITFWWLGIVLFWWKLSIAYTVEDSIKRVVNYYPY